MYCINKIYLKIFACMYKEYTEHFYYKKKLFSDSSDVNLGFVIMPVERKILNLEATKHILIFMS